MLTKEQNRILTETCNKYRKPFISFAQKNHELSQEDAENIYQETMTTIHHNVINGKINNLNEPLKAYLFRIGIIKIHDHFRKKRKTVEISNLPDILSSDEEMYLYLYGKEEDDVVKRDMIIYNTVSQMENPCKKILTLVYWEKKSMKEIAEQMNISSPDVAKTTKSRCMKKIEQVLTKKFDEAEIYYRKLKNKTKRT